MKIPPAPFHTYNYPFSPERFLFNPIDPSDKKGNRLMSLGNTSDQWTRLYFERHVPVDNRRQLNVVFANVEKRTSAVSLREVQS